MHASHDDIVRCIVLTQDSEKRSDSGDSSRTDSMGSFTSLSDDMHCVQQYLLVIEEESIVNRLLRYESFSSSVVQLYFDNATMVVRNLRCLPCRLCVSELEISLAWLPIGDTDFACTNVLLWDLNWWIGWKGEIGRYGFWWNRFTFALYACLEYLFCIFFIVLYIIL